MLPCEYLGALRGIVFTCLVLTTVFCSAISAGSSGQLRLHTTSAENPPLTETMSLDSPCSPENTLVVAVPPYTRPRTTVVVQVRTGGHLPFDTPRRHQGCDSLPQIMEKLPRAFTHLWPNSHSPPTRMCAAAALGHRPCSAVSASYNPVN